MSYDREIRRMNARDRRMHGWTKPLLVEALREMQTVCPPRVSRQNKKDLERIVNGVLDLPDDNPVRIKMVDAPRQLLLEQR